MKSANIVVPWKQRRRFLRDENHHEALTRHVEASFPGDDHPVARAVELVFEASGEGVSTWRGILTYEAADLERLCLRAGMPVPESLYGYTDSRGDSHLPFECALTVAKAFAAAEPSAVLLAVDLIERQYETEARQPGERHLLRLLNEYRPAFALVRQWAGHDAAIAAREAEIQELRQLLSRVMWDLRAEGVDPHRVAKRIERALRGR